MSKWFYISVASVMVLMLMTIGVNVVETEKQQDQLDGMKVKMEELRIEQQTVDHLLDLLQDYQSMLLETQAENDRLKELLDRIGVDVFEITAYSPFDDRNGLNSDGNPWSTATGTVPTAGRTIAVDPTVIPYGTQVWIKDFGWRIAEDTGGMIKGNRLDIMVDTYSEAMKIGRQNRVVLYAR